MTAILYWTVILDDCAPPWVMAVTQDSKPFYGRHRIYGINEQGKKCSSPIVRSHGIFTSMFRAIEVKADLLDIWNASEANLADMKDRIRAIRRDCTAAMLDRINLRSQARP